MNPRHPAWKAGTLPLSYSRSLQTLHTFISYRRATRGLTARGEEWLQDTITKFLEWLQVPLTEVSQEHITTFLVQYEGKPWRRHSFYRGLRSFWKWYSAKYGVDNPMTGIEAPKLPQKLLYSQTPQTVHALIEAAETVRNKAIVALIADSGARRSEIVGIQVSDVDLNRNRIKVLGKGDREGYLLFGSNTKTLLKAYMDEARPKGSLFQLKANGVKTMFRRLGERSGIKASPHSFRRGFATELRRKGVGELDIMQLGRWTDLRMVQHYTRSHSFEDAAQRFVSIVD